MLRNSASTSSNLCLTVFLGLFNSVSSEFFYLSFFQDVFEIYYHYVLIRRDVVLDIIATI
jgi:hypothetical protein